MSRLRKGEAKAHFVTFYSPGTFFAEDTEKPISRWSVKLAMEMAHDVVERYNATPFGFRFHTRTRGPKDLDSKVTRSSVGTYFLGGKILTLKQVKQTMPNEKILISNMEGNRWGKIVVNDNSWRTIQPFRDKDVLLDWKPKPKEKCA